MIPVYEELPIDDDWTDDEDSDQVDATEETQLPGLTYKLDPVTHTISAMPVIDDVESVKQAVYIMLQTARGEYAIYDANYGTEIYDLIGDPIPLAYAEVEMDIKDTLAQDDRIDEVKDFSFYSIGNALLVKFTVVTNVGNNDEIETGVIVNG